MGEQVFTTLLAHLAIFGQLELDLLDGQRGAFGLEDGGFIFCGEIGHRGGIARVGSATKTEE